MIDNQNGDALTETPFFDASFIKQTRAKRIIGKYTYKAKGDIMREKDYQFTYTFDREGRLQSTCETRPDDGTKDTTWNLFAYDHLGELCEFRKTDIGGYTLIRYERDSLGRVISKKYFKEVLDSTGNVASTITFNEEKSEFSNVDQQTRRTCYNSYNLPYLDEYWNYNEDGYLTERIKRIRMTSTVYTYSYEYNEEGLLSAIRKSSNRQEGYLEEMTFKYDELGNLIEKHEYKNGEFISDIQLIYNSASKLFSAILTRDVKTDFIVIIRFQEYEFYH